jgi:predicted nucleic acid-binding Zn ribbon protein
MAGQTPGREGRARSRPTHVGDAVQSFLAKSGLARRLAQAQVIPDWARLVGPQIARVTVPESVTPDGTLFVRVATSAWMTELQLMGPQIMAAINAGRGAGRIKTIRWLLSQ